MMRYWISRVLREAREGKASREAVRLLIPNNTGGFIDSSTLSRFEAGKTWPRELDLIVPAYAAVTGYEDPRKLWELAVRRYLLEGAVPQLGDTSPVLLSVRAAQEAAQRSLRHGGGSSGTPSAKRRRAAGS